jgi:2-phosphosulfolactate phosphatase
MKVVIEVLLSPADYEARQITGFAGQTCVVFDVLRATSVIVTGLAHGAEGFVPVREIAEAVAQRANYPGALLAGEREGLRITAPLSGGVEFDLGNSPREYTAERVRGRTIIATTTNGTRALRACVGAPTVLAGAFLNLRATAEWLARVAPRHIVMVCAGTGSQPALEDVFGAGALVQKLAQLGLPLLLDDAAMLAQRSYATAAANLIEAVGATKNGRRLLAMSELAADVDFCLQLDRFEIVAQLDEAGVVRRSPVAK